MEPAFPCGESIFVFNGDLHEHFLDWTPDGSQIIFGHGKTIHSIGADGSHLQFIVDVNPVHDLRYYFHADVSPVSSRIVYTTCRFPTDPPTWWWPAAQGADDPLHREYDRIRHHYEIATVKINGSDTRRLTENIHLDHYPAWSPDGKRIAFISNSQEWLGESGQLYTMAADGSDPRLLTPSFDTIGLYPPVWSPDGQRIAVIGLEGKSRPFQRVIYTVGADGSDLTRILETLSVPSWSPESSELVFARAGEEAGIYAVRPDGTDLRLITPAKASRVSWSPDGDQVLFIAGAVYLVGADGNGLREIGGPQYINAVWSPDGSRIAMLGFEYSIPQWRWGEYNSTGRIVTVARDGTDLRVLARWEPRDGRYDQVDLVAGTPDSVGTPDDSAPCEAGVVVPSPDSNPGLVKDCEVLLALMDKVAARVFLDWSTDRPLAQWEGVTIGGSPVRIRELALQEYGLSGTIPPELGDLTALERLNLRWNSLSGNIPKEIVKLTELRTLRLDGNRLSGPIPKELSLLTNLEVLNLSRNSLTGAIPLELGCLANLERLSLSANQLTGAIPPELGLLVNLQMLYLAGNDLTGSIPPELGRLANLRRLSLWVNHLTGNIPPELGDLSNLKVLKLAANELTGSIPPELGNLSNLQVLNLSNNELTGSIPPELGNLSNLETLSLSVNRLSGSIPPELSGLQKLGYVGVFLNDLSGCLPAGLSSMWDGTAGLERCEPEER